MNRGVIIALLLCSTASQTLHAQPNGMDIKFRLAQSYERTGDFDSAVKLYQDILSKDSTNRAVLDAIRRDLVQLKRYDDAISVLRGQLRRSPTDITLLADLGSMFILKSDESSAVATWEEAISIDPRHELTYRIVTGAMIQNRQFERAIDLYKRARIALNEPSLFGEDIGYLYGIMLNYKEATGEYLMLLRQNPSMLAFVQSRIGAYSDHTDGLLVTTISVENVINTEPDNVTFRQLLAWLYMEGKRFDRAYEVYRTIDRKRNAAGHELFTFATRALHEKAYDVAAEAFQDILTSYPRFDRTAEATFDYAQALEASDNEPHSLRLFGSRSPFRPDPEVSQRYSRAIDAYKRVISENSNTEFAARALLRVAIIREEKYLDLNSAKAGLETLEERYQQFPTETLEGRLCLGSVYLQLGDMARAESEYQSIAGDGSTFSDQQASSTLRLAELDYFQEHFQEALAKLKTITANPTSDATSYALSLQILIEGNITPSDSALRQFAHADLLRHQHKLSEALPLLESIITTYPGTPIIDETLLTIGDTYVEMNRFSDAIAAYQRLRSDIPQSIYLDGVLLKIGEVYQRGIGDPAKAIENYQQLLEKYPNSIYASEARRRIRELRGDNI